MGTSVGVCLIVRRYGSVGGGVVLDICVRAWGSVWVDGQVAMDGCEW